MEEAMIINQNNVVHQQRQLFFLNELFLLIDAIVDTFLDDVGEPWHLKVSIAFPENS